MSTKNFCLCGNEKIKISKQCRSCEFSSRKKNPHHKPLDISGQVFNNWTALKRVVGVVNSTWLCRCKCGTERNVQVGTLRSGLSKSCGNCIGYRRDSYEKRMRIIWGGMKSRCENRNQVVYKYYGGRGIKIVWKDFESFSEDMRESYIVHVQKHGVYNTTIDRVDNNGNYEKSNCKWSTQREQCLNRRGSSRKSYIPEHVENFSRLCRERGIGRMTVLKRLQKGAELEEALSRPILGLATNQVKKSYTK